MATRESKESLSTFLQNPPIKKKATLVHICNALGIDDSGTIPDLVAKIVQHAKQQGDEQQVKEFENQVRQMAREYTNTNDNKMANNNKATNDNKTKTKPSLGKEEDKPEDILTLLKAQQTDFLKSICERCALETRGPKVTIVQTIMTHIGNKMEKEHVVREMITKKTDNNASGNVCNLNVAPSLPSPDQNPTSPNQSKRLAHHTMPPFDDESLSESESESADSFHSTDTITGEIRDMEEEKHGKDVDQMDIMISQLSRIRRKMQDEEVIELNDTGASGNSIHLFDTTDTNIPEDVMAIKKQSDVDMTQFQQLLDNDLPTSKNDEKPEDSEKIDEVKDPEASMPGQSCIDENTGKLKCPDGIMVKNRFIKIVQKQKTQITNLVQIVESQKSHKDEISRQLDQKDIEIQQLQAETEKLQAERLKTCENDILDQLKGMNEKLMEEIEKLISHNSEMSTRMAETNGEMVHRYKTKVAEMERNNSLLCDKLKDATSMIQKQGETERDLLVEMKEVKGIQEKQGNNTSAFNEIRRFNQKQEKWNIEVSNLLTVTASKVKALHDVSNKAPPLAPTNSYGAPMSSNQPYTSRVPQTKPIPPAKQINPLPPMPNMYETRETVLVLKDSNGAHLRPGELHRQKNVQLETRYTLSSAVDHIPRIESPENVSDIVVLIGINDNMNPKETNQETEDKHLKLMKVYNEAFPNAHFHIGAVPPTSFKQERLNARLQSLAQRTGESFISLNEMYDRHDKVRLRPGMLKGGDEIHYTEVGIKILAKEVKRSLHEKNWRNPALNETNLVSTPSLISANDPGPNTRFAQNIIKEMKQLMAQIPTSPVRI